MAVPLETALSLAYFKRGYASLHPRSPPLLVLLISNGPRSMGFLNSVETLSLAYFKQIDEETLQELALSLAYFKQEGNGTKQVYWLEAYS